MVLRRRPQGRMQRHRAGAHTCSSRGLWSGCRGPQDTASLRGFRLRIWCLFTPLHASSPTVGPCELHLSLQARG